MEIREHLSVYLESGYLFDDMSGKLKWFEIDKILISFTYGVVRYVGTWGGCRAEKTLDGKYTYKCRRSRVILGYEDNCPLTGMCYDYYLLKPIIDYYDTWCTYPEDFSLEDLIEKCYNNFFKAWHEEYEHWADDEDAIREELHHNQYEDRLYYEDGDVYVGPLNEIA